MGHISLNDKCVNTSSRSSNWKNFNFFVGAWILLLLTCFCFSIHAASLVGNGKPSTGAASELQTQALVSKQIDIMTDAMLISCIGVCETQLRRPFVFTWINFTKAAAQEVEMRWLKKVGSYGKNSVVPFANAEKFSGSQEKILNRPHLFPGQLKSLFAEALWKRTHYRQLFMWEQDKVDFTILIAMAEPNYVRGNGLIDKSKRRVRKVLRSGEPPSKCAKLFEVLRAKDNEDVFFLQFGHAQAYDCTLAYLILFQDTQENQAFVIQRFYDYVYNQASSRIHDAALTKLEGMHLK